MRLSILILLVAMPVSADEFQPIGLSPSWQLTWGGYVHVAYRWIDQPQNFNLVGKNSGFQLEQARLGANVQYKEKLALRVSFEGASEDRINQSFVGGNLTARLRDAYITWAPLRYIRISIGQMLTPWDLDSMRSNSELPFVSPSLPVEGVQSGEGRTVRGMGQDRNIGVMLHSGDIGLGRFVSLRYAIFVGNGNGQNQVVNDNNLPAVFGRLELAVWGNRGLPSDQIGPIRARTDVEPKPWFGIGVAGQYNPRTTGNPPDLINETDAGAAVDLIAFFYGVDLEAGLLYIKTIHDTLTAVPDIEKLGWWAHARFTIPRIPILITFGYRIASYSPRAHLSTSAPMVDEQRDADLDLLYHTFGIALRPTRSFPLHFDINYTLTTEQGANVLSNDRVEADVVAVF